MERKLKQKYFVVYSEQHPDGQIYNEQNYRELRQSMSLKELDRHQVVEISAATANFLTAIEQE